MQYRTFPKSGEKVSLLGFGTMRLPKIGDSIDEKNSIHLIRTAIDNGINYIDTAYAYPGSEVVVGKALKNGYRGKVFLADKMPAWKAKTETELQHIFDEQLQRLDTDYIDMYLIHNVTKKTWKAAKNNNCLKFLEEKKAKGQIRYIGFSFHDDLNFFKEVIDSYLWDFCQIQLNYMDTNFQAGIAGLNYAAQKGLKAIIMEPLKGGLLTDTIPASVEAAWNRAIVNRTPAEWAFRWVADFPEVMTILSGMNTMKQLKENLRILSEATPNSLTSEEQQIIKNVSYEYSRLIKYSCTHCNYCMPCPQKLNIPSIVSLCNEWYLYNGNPKIHNDFYACFREDRRPSNCIACKACEEKCPQALPIHKIMKTATGIFER